MGETPYPAVHTPYTTHHYAEGEYPWIARKIMKYDIRSRVWDLDGRTVHYTSIAQGEHSVSDDPDAVITTVLGSCVAACIRDPAAGIGGMNHFVLPEQPQGATGPYDKTRYGSYLMQRLVDDLLERGANPRRLEAQIFGGASPGSSYYNIGERNVAFALKFLADRGIATRDASRIGQSGCKLEYWPVSGKTVHSPLAMPPKPKPPLIKLRRIMPLVLPPVAA